MIDEGALNGILVSEEWEVVDKLVVGGDDNAMPTGVILRPTCTTEYLKHIQNTQVHHVTSLAVVDIRALQREKMHTSVYRRINQGNWLNLSYGIKMVQKLLL